MKSLTGSVKVGTPSTHPDLRGRAVPDEVLQKHIDKNYTLSANLQLKENDCVVIPKLLICTVLLSHLGIVLLISACLSAALPSRVVCSVTGYTE